MDCRTEVECWSVVYMDCCAVVERRSVVHMDCCTVGECRWLVRMDCCTVGECRSLVRMEVSFSFNNNLYFWLCNYTKTALVFCLATPVSVLTKTLWFAPRKRCDLWRSTANWHVIIKTNIRHITKIWYSFGCIQNTSAARASPRTPSRSKTTLAPRTARQYTCTRARQGCWGQDLLASRTAPTHHTTASYTPLTGQYHLLHSGLHIYLAVINIFFFQV